jgi:hypothetical protein
VKPGSYYVFVGNQSNAQPEVISEQRQVASVSAGAAKQDIRSIDFQNLVTSRPASTKLRLPLSFISPRGG